MRECSQKVDTYIHYTPEREVFKISIPSLNVSTRIHKSVGAKKLGYVIGLRKAQKLRNELGRDVWGKHWGKILSEPWLLKRLPYSLEPKRLIKNGVNVDHEYYRVTYYKEERVKVEELFSINKLGTLPAYIQAKERMQELYADKIPLLQHMGRISIIKLH